MRAKLRRGTRCGIAAAGTGERLAKLAVGIMLIAALGVAVTARAQQPNPPSNQPPQSPPSLSQAEIENEAMLDKLLADRNYAEIVKRIKEQNGTPLIVPTLNWEKARMIAGASEFVSLQYAQLLWNIGLNPQFNNLKETSALITAYGLLVTYSDGVKCADQSAPGHHLEVIMMNFRVPLQFLAQLPSERQNNIFHTALAMEKGLSRLRHDDDYLCRFGMDEMRHNLEKNGPGHEVPSSPGQVGKTVVVTSDPGYEPKFLSPAEWEPKQASVRAQFETMLPTIIDKFKNIPAQQPAGMPPSSKP